MYVKLDRRPFIPSLEALAMRRSIAMIDVGALDERAIRHEGPVHLEDLWGPGAGGGISPWSCFRLQ